ncbi:MAG: hypothetical protein A2261_00290, partial [Candidatus Magasanikbacteria bacterium RIFOXYA2_FULL_44_8]
INLENLLSAWLEFIVGKKNKKDVRFFHRDLMDNIISLHTDLKSGTYHHGDYESFFVNDPKRRHIHKASVRDRLVHHAIYRILYPFFERTFIGDSYSCRVDKGTHRAIERFRAVVYKVGQNHTRTCWILKCDIRKFFASIDHKILLGILSEYIPDKDIMCLLGEVVGSYETDRDSSSPFGLARNDSCCGDGRRFGLPLGNLTSQLFANVYMNVFDQFVKHKLKVKNYIRYADDFVFLSEDKLWLENLIPQIQNFLSKELKLTLHPDKLFLQTIASGVDFLGWVNFTDHHVLCGTTKKRMMRRVCEHPTDETLQSYLGMLGWGNGTIIKNSLLNDFWLWSQ